MGLLEDCKRLFETENLYEVLGVEAAVEPTALKRAYHKKAIKFHPDKGGDTEKFQALSKTYHILADAEQRSIYDDTGDIPGDDPFSDRPPNQTWADYFSERFSDVTTQLLDEDKQAYQGSPEERAHVKESYLKCKGDMALIVENVMHSTILDDEDRFRAMIREMIKVGEVEAYPKFTSESAKATKERRRKARAEAAEAEAALREIQAKSASGTSGNAKRAAGKGSVTKGVKGSPIDITAMIRANQSKRNAAFGSLFDKFGAGAEPPDLPDEAFAAVGARAARGSAGGRKKKK